MVVDYFKKTPLDEAFYAEHIEARLPRKLMDVHIHLSDPKLVGKRLDAQWDWAAACCDSMNIEGFHEVVKTFHPDREVEILALPPVSAHLDHAACNDYMASIMGDGSVRSAEMVVRPEWTAEYVEQQLVENHFAGFKPYPDLVAGKKGSEIGIFEFIPHHQLAVLDRHKAILTLHIGRPGRLPDPNNIHDLLEMRQKYPDIKIIIAHCGRSYAVDTIRRGLEGLGSHAGDFLYDLAAVLNPEVLRRVFDRLPHDQIFYGTDLPVFLWHGRRRWTDTEYFNLCREDFWWNKHEEGAETEAKYTFFLYEQLRNLLDVTDEFEGQALREKIFYENANRLVSR